MTTITDAERELFREIGDTTRALGAKGMCRDELRTYTAHKIAEKAHLAIVAFPAVGWIERIRDRFIEFDEIDGIERPNAFELADFATGLIESRFGAAELIGAIDGELWSIPLTTISEWIPCPEIETLDDFIRASIWLLAWQVAVAILLMDGRDMFGVRLP